MFDLVRLFGKPWQEEYLLKQRGDHKRSYYSDDKSGQQNPVHSQQLLRAGIVRDPFGSFEEPLNPKGAARSTTGVGNVPPGPALLRNPESAARLAVAFPD